METKSLTKASETFIRIYRLEMAHKDIISIEKIDLL